MSEPFVKLPHAVIDHADLNAHELLVYIVLLRFRNPQTNQCFPGLQTIADSARISRNSVRRAVEKLEAKGIIAVERVKAVGSKTNASNTYTVGNLPEDPMKYLANSAKGQRVPKRDLSDDARAKLAAAARKGSSSEPLPSSSSEALPSDKSNRGSASQALRSASEASGVVPPRHGKKNKIKKINEEDLTHAFEESTFANVSFEVSDDQPATEKQVMYLKDLVIHQGYEAGHQVIPSEEHLNRWRKMTKREAHDHIRAYLKALGRPDDIYYPEYGDPEYEALSEAGKAFAESGGMPDSVYPFSSKKEQVA